MPLTAQLQHGVLGEWCARRFSGTGRVIGRVRAAAGTTDPIRPIGVVDVRHWSIVGGALAQRFGFAVQHAPPYGALLGCYRSGLADWAHVQELAASFPTHRSLDARRSRATQLRPLARGQGIGMQRFLALGGQTPEGERRLGELAGELGG